MAKHTWYVHCGDVDTFQFVTRLEGVDRDQGFYEDARVEDPSGSGHMMTRNLIEVTKEALDILKRSRRTYGLVYHVYYKASSRAKIVRHIFDAKTGPILSP